MNKDTEQDILKFWEDNQIYEKTKKAKGKKFYLMDGPPYATGHIHMGTALNKILKDIAMRFHRLKKHKVIDRPGYDTHGLPIEFQIEKEIGTKSKQDIEKFGVKKFIEKCKQYATSYLDVMNDEFKDLGVWMDFKNPYLTLSPEYIETIWDVFKIADKKGLLYKDKYPIHLCPRCETAVAYNEIEYAKQEDTSIFVKFPLNNKENTYLIIWTTTPWTLPGNTGVMVNPDYTYQEIALSSGEKWIICKQLIPKIMAELETGYTIKKEYQGKEMQGWKYKNPLEKHLKLDLDKEKAYRVVLSKRYVTDEEGTGLVHTAPGHGKEDYEVGKENNLPAISPVGMDGLLTKEAGKYANKKARQVDKEIIEDLEKDKMLVYKKAYTHDYPLCWRCKSPLLMISQPQWFLKISSIQKDLLKENNKNNWIPNYMKLRMKAWLEGISDWPVSRKRYWGTPLPIWTCSTCNKKKVIGSIKELEELSQQTIKGVHRPEIDKIKIKCECGGEIKRVEDVLDVWFDSGVSSWAALNDKKYWPADLNIEGKDQIRGWWNSQMILSQIKHGKKPFNNILVHGMVLDLGKTKMSKSKGNVITPKEITDKYGRDYMRYYFAKSSKGEDFAFDENEFKDIKNLFRVLINVNNFINQINNKKPQKRIEDKWISSRLNSACKNIETFYKEFKFPEAVREIENFLIEDLSKTYIKMIRDRADETSLLLKKIRLVLLKLLAPIIPFTTEKIWQSLREKKLVKEESIHLTKWPEHDDKQINKKLEEDMQTCLEIIEAGLRERDKAEIGLKWPLKKATITCQKKLNKQLQEIIAKQLNVKQVEITTGAISVKLDTKLNEELEAEGYAREIARKIQAERKKAGLDKQELIELAIESDLNNKFKRKSELIKERVNAKSISFKDASRYNYSQEGKIKGISFKIGFNKLSSEK
ncbi:MAG: isoleucine--tRNA ligase [Candidatus Nanoarchaeia archaeon]